MFIVKAFEMKTYVTSVNDNVYLKIFFLDKIVTSFFDFHGITINFNFKFGGAVIGGRFKIDTVTIKIYKLAIKNHFFFFFNQAIRCSMFNLII